MCTRSTPSLSINAPRIYFTSSPGLRRIQCSKYSAQLTQIEREKKWRSSMWYIWPLRESQENHTSRQVKNAKHRTSLTARWTTKNTTGLNSFETTAAYCMREVNFKFRAHPRPSSIRSRMKRNLYGKSRLGRTRFAISFSNPRLEWVGSWKE